MIGDSVYNILWQLVESAGGVPAPRDLERDLLRKYLDAIKTGADDENDPQPGDTFIMLLAKVLRRRGGSPALGDLEWNLLVKWLALEGECRRCGDLIHSLWRKILETILGADPLLPPPTIMFVDGGSSPSLTWTWDGPDPFSFEIEVNQDGAGFANPELVSGTARDYFRDGDGGAHTWVFRIRARNETNPITDWAESAEVVVTP